MCAMAKHLLFLLAASVFMLVAHGASVNDTECHDKLKDFGKCMSKGKKDDADKVKKIGKQISKCFDDNKCTEPDYEADPFDNHTGILKNLSIALHDAWSNTPDKVKQCLKHGFRLFVTKKLNQCLKKQNVDEIKLDDDDIHDVYQHALKPRNFTDEQKKGHHDKKELKAFVNTVFALKRCGKENGREAVNSTLQCIGGVKEDVKTEVCKVVASCRKDAVSDDCRKRSHEIRKAICECQHDKLVEIKARLDKLQDGKHHTPQDFKGILGVQFEEDRNETLNGIKNCFDINKAEAPQPLDLILFGILLAGHHEHRGHEVALPLLMAVTIYDTGDKRDVSPDEIWFLNTVVGDLISHNDCGCD